MVDIRKLERTSKAYVKSGEPLCFRLVLHNGAIVERSFNPIDHVDNAEEIFYSRKKTTYSPIDEYVVTDIADIDLTKVSSFTTIESTLSTKNGCILHTIEQLLKSGYCKI